MDVEIINQPLQLSIHGFSGVALNKDYAGTAFKLSGRMWEIVKAGNIKNKGINIWVYEPGEVVFTGLELDGIPQQETGLEQKNISLAKYAYYKHIGPYNQIRQAGLNMQNELKNKGFETCLPYIEIYGHWKADETQSETELLMSIK